MIWMSLSFYFLVLAISEASFLFALSGQVLYVRYPGKEWIHPGSTLDTKDTVVMPEINGKNLPCHARYLLLFIDLDAMFPGTRNQTVVLHWYRPNLMFKCQGNDNYGFLHSDKNGKIIDSAPYIAPQPPPLSRHRYVYLLFEQPTFYQFPQCFTHIFPATMEARAGFDIKEFMLAATLNPPLAINYFFGKNTTQDKEDPSPPPSATTTYFRSVICDTSPTSLR
ncbi:hypothetical protein N7462_000842 [Penicillium macrosclerotiorum]|uniref:uncharacterized protein n=1 Tax=Penicillium macrosclerotiorum TaxID=303699 RepID=UPI00254765EE|nr:uncharacterized protein N7462_000842 [Penicillium macrosclerotiorum]KAJ5698837.1 hypothetical protein N7462_000842 [Penicillium macrosclerotiorum]